MWSDALRLVMAELQLEDVTRVHPDGSVAVADLSLHVRNGELLALVGPSGSGKSTTLRLIAGLEPVTSGTISIGGNLRFGLEMGRVPKSEIDLRVQAESRVLGVARLLGRLPRTLSAGQRQRVAVGRATVRVPDVFLLDEPLTHLDAANRDRLRQELSTLQHGMGVTTVYVTHDQGQAMAIGDRIAVLRRGRLEQVDTPRAVYRRPDNTFVASFLGSPGMSLLPATLERDADGTWIGVSGQRLRFPGEPAGALRRYVGRPVVIGLRPEDVTAARGAEPRAAGGAAGGGAAGRRHRRLRLTATRVEHLGPELLVACAVDAPAVVVEDAGADPLPITEGATLHARFPAHSAVRLGDLVDVEVDVTELTYFDPGTGTALWHPL